MDAALVDTDVFSFFFKNDTRAGFYTSHIGGKQLCLCFQTIAELNLWALGRNWGVSRRSRLDEVLKRYVVLPYDGLMARHWAEITLIRRRKGMPIGCGDAWIAAAALRYGIPLLTHNARDYMDIEKLKVVSETS